MAIKKSQTGRVLAAVAGVLLLASCESQLKPSPYVIENFITGVTDASGTVAAALRQGSAPAPNGGPTNTVSGFAAMVTGGSSQQTLTGGAAFTQVIVVVPGMDNYWELTVPSGVTTPIIIRAASTLPNMSLGLQYAVGDGATVGAYSSQNVRIISVGGGDVQVSVSWSDSSDVDLHVIDPNGDEIFYGAKTSPSGGTLDLDSNAACSRNSDNTFKSNENVVWPLGGGAHGTYTVKLAYWAACGVTAPTEYVITVAVVGSAPQFFTGSFTGPGIGGGAGTGNLITTFTF